MKILEFRFEFHSNLFLGVQMTIYIYIYIYIISSDNDITWTNADPVYWYIYAALGGDELIPGNRYLSQSQSGRLICFISLCTYVLPCHISILYTYKYNNNSSWYRMSPWWPLLELQTGTLYFSQVNTIWGSVCICTVTRRQTGEYLYWCSVCSVLIRMTGSQVSNHRNGHQTTCFRNNNYFCK